MTAQPSPRNQATPHSGVSQLEMSHNGPPERRRAAVMLEIPRLPHRANFGPAPRRRSTQRLAPRSWPPSHSPEPPSSRDLAVAAPAAADGSARTRQRPKAPRRANRRGLNARRATKGPASSRRRGPQCRSISSESDLRETQRVIHLMILVTRPEPTVRPPSRMAKPRPGSIAIGWISWTEISVVSPGMTMSVPSGRVMTPVTSVVRK